ncbi:hypothetical protein SLEP1_g52300 [Rubroshorea leprosula]|uniref:F-box domain-containing protein n=1 Tax=Rubroshorea leprosula TaxID=152421 RepID=A0AAV5M858_9ROSI|nr:hypothetical protein SLEP1_g52300 [Rubroshorea leprosula]
MAAMSMDLVIDILLRLPVKSLLRFRCVSTSFCSEIDSADFVNTHVNRSIQSRTGQKLIVSGSSSCNGPTDFYAADFEDDLKAAFLLNNPLKSQHGSNMVCGSCNGLILLGMLSNSRFRRTEHAIWNPFTRRYKKVPICPVQTLPGYCWYFNIGLGYDSAHDDYKIIMISLVVESNHFSYPVWLFSLKSSSWRRSQDFLLELRNGSREIAGRFANGALYWDGSDGIVGFDIANEVFFMIQKSSGYLVVLGGNLYIPVPRADDKDVDFYLYASDNGGEVASGSWRKEFTVEEEVLSRYNVLRLWPLAYSKDGDSILLLTKENGFVWYNFENKTRQRVEIPGMPKVMLEDPTKKHCVNLESLVSVGNDSAFDGAAEEVILND